MENVKNNNDTSDSEDFTVLPKYETGLTLCVIFFIAFIFLTANGLFGTGASALVGVILAILCSQIFFFMVVMRKIGSISNNSKR